MTKPTDPIQPVVYETMVLAQALIDLRRYVSCRSEDADFPKRESALGSALIRIRSLAEFWRGIDPTNEGKPTKGRDLITVASMRPQWPRDTTFYAACWQPISEYVGHLIDKRCTKTTKRPTADFAQRYGRKILAKTVREIERRTAGGEITLVGDAKRWYPRLRQLSRQLTVSDAQGRGGVTM